MAGELGDAALGQFPTVPSLEFSGRVGADRLLRRTWMPSLAVIGIDGVPSVKDGGNVLRPFTTVKLSLRLPPVVDAERAAEAVADVPSADPPQRARVRAVVVNVARGFDVPLQAEWLARATDEASEALFGRPAGAMSEGGTIPFLAELASRFPEANFLVTGVLGPGSNAHGLNEMLDLVYGTASHHRGRIRARCRRPDLEPKARGSRYRRSDASSRAPSAPFSQRHLDAANVTVLVDENDDVDIAESGEVVTKRVHLLTSELQQESTAAP